MPHDLEGFRVVVDPLEQRERVLPGTAREGLPPCTDRVDHGRSIAVSGAAGYRQASTGFPLVIE